MKSSRLFVWGSIFASLLLAGCIRYHYDGKELPPTGKKVEVFWKKVEIVRPYEVMGNAEVWGNYQDCSRGSLLEKLENKAAAAGADAILVLNYAVTTSERKSAGNAAFTSSFDIDDTSSSSWKMIEKDVDLTYGNARGRGSNAAAIQTIRRVMKAEYLHYTRQAAGKTADAVRKTTPVRKESDAKAAVSPDEKNVQKSAVKTVVKVGGASAKAAQTVKEEPAKIGAAPLPIAADPKVNPAKPNNGTSAK